MEGILVIAHGSRVKETENTLKTILDMVIEKMPAIHIEYAFMEFSDRNIAYALEQLVEKNVTDIKVVPYFLFSGIHLKQDIPHTIEECMKKHPHIKITMGQPLGTDERLAEILIDRIRD